MAYRLTLCLNNQKLVEKEKILAFNKNRQTSNSLITIKREKVNNFVLSKTPYQNLKENQKISFISLINKIKNKPINLNLNQTKIPEKSKIEVIQSFRHSSENAYFKLNKSHRTMIDGRIEPFDSINKNKFKKILLKKKSFPHHPITFGKIV